VGLTVGNEVNDTPANIMAKVFDVRGACCVWNVWSIFKAYLFRLPGIGWSHHSCIHCTHLGQHSQQPYSLRCRLCGGKRAVSSDHIAVKNTFDSSLPFYQRFLRRGPNIRSDRRLCLQDRCSCSQGRLSRQEDHNHRVRII